MKCEAMSRLMYLFFAAMALAEPLHSGPYFVLLGLCVGVLLIDYVVNDLLPERFHFRWALQQRAVMYITLAFVYISALFVGELRGMDLPALTHVRFLGMSAFGVILGFKEVLHMRGMRCLN